MTAETNNNEKIYKTFGVQKLRKMKDHPFQVRDDEEMRRLEQSIREHGVLEPIIVRPVTENGETVFEIVSGHRRYTACRNLGLRTVAVVIRNMTDDEAVTSMVDSNLHREHILPSEKAFAYKMKLDAMKHQGKATSDQVGPKLSVEEVSDEDSATQVKRYIRLTFLIPELLELVDAGKIALSPATELSFLGEQEQFDLLTTIESEDCTPSLSQAVRMKKLSQQGELTMDAIFGIMTEEKCNQKETVRIRLDRIGKFFPDHYTVKQIEESIVSMLVEQEKQQKRQKGWER